MIKRDKEEVFPLSLNRNALAAIYLVLTHTVLYISTDEYTKGAHILTIMRFYRIGSNRTHTHPFHAEYEIIANDTQYSLTRNS